MRKSTVFYASILILLAIFKYSDAQEAVSGSDPGDIRSPLESVQGLKIHENSPGFVIHRMGVDGNIPVNLTTKRSTYNQTEMQVMSVEIDPLPLPFSEGFEGDMSGWTALDIDGDGNTWDIYSSKPRTGERSAAVRWNTAGNDDWLISPLLAFPAGHNITLSFWASSGLSSFPETFEVAVINNGGDNYDIIARVEDVPVEYTQFTYDLSQYSGQDVNVAIICVSVDQYYLHVDDFLIESEATTDPDPQPDPDPDPQPDPDPGYDTVTDIDGNIYKTVQIGSQIWMAENLKTTRYHNGELILYPGEDNNAWQGATNGAYAWYGNDDQNKEVYGALYNWYAVSTGLLCPAGWHAPEDLEWTMLTDYLTEVGHEGNQGTVLKAESGWDMDGNGTDLFEFGALPGGYRLGGGGYNNKEWYGYWWASTEYHADNGMLRSMRYSESGITRHSIGAWKAEGYSVRCMENSVPVITTREIENITHDAAKSGGIVLVNSGEAVTNRGVVWSTSENPALNEGEYNGYTEDGDGTGVYSSNFGGLAAGTTYYVRAYATNAIGTGYGDQLSFTTEEDPGSEPDPGNGFVTDIDGNEYDTVRIGNQTWFVQNLKVTRFNNGDEIVNVQNSTDWGEVEPANKWAHYNNDQVNDDIYGKLYNGEVAIDSRNVCPDGWHVPSTDEWDILIDYLGGAEVAGDKLMATELWETPNNATNESGFTALPGGYRSSAGDFLSLIYSTEFYSSSAPNTWSSDYVYMHHDGTLYLQNSFGTGTGRYIRCVKDSEEEVTEPAVSTAIITSVGQSAATGGGEVTDDGGDAVTVRGVVWNTTENSTIADNLGITQDGEGVGQFTSDITGLTTGTLYYVRAYATNSIGTAYGDQVSFTTENDPYPEPVDGTVTDIDGNVYNTVQIGNRVWMSENLRVTRYSNGDEIPNITDNSEWNNQEQGAWAWYDNDDQYEAKFGILYNGFAVRDERNVCPDGWSVPTRDHWVALVDYVGGDETAGEMLKAVGTELWDSPNTDARDVYGFGAAGGGYRSSPGGFGYVGRYGDYWTSEGFDNLNSYYRRFSYVHARIDGGSQASAIGASVRCVYDILASITVPEVITGEISYLTHSAVHAGGEVVFDGGALVTAKGIVWGTVENPTVNNNEGITEDGDGMGEFFSRLSGLTPGTQFHLRAYATNSEGSGYGDQVTFTSGASGEGTVTDSDGNVYNTTKIGAQIWMSENLRTTKYANGDEIEAGLTDSEWSNTSSGAFTVYPVDDVAGIESEEEMLSAYGALYNWHAATDERGLCPAGWKLPDDDDWLELSNYLKDEIHLAVNGVGNALKSCLQESSPLAGDCNVAEHPRWNAHDTHYGTDDFGFAALPAGERNSSGTYRNIGDKARWWSASPYLARAYHWSINYDNSPIYTGRDYKEFGLSVRCMKDPDFQPTEPVITTISVTDITQTGAVAGGNITSDGGLPVTARGVVWSTTENPTIEDNLGISQDGNGMGEFTSDITGLDPETTYYIRAYASNSAGTGYGEQISFATVVTGSEILSGSKLTVYPNPVKDRLTFENSNDILRIVIRNLSGQTVAEINESGSRQLTMDVNHLVKGIYIMTVVDVTGEQSVLKLVKY